MQKIHDLNEEHFKMDNKTQLLVVDDNPENIRILGAALAKDNRKIAVALSGEKALQLIQKIQPDLILLDVMMPEMNGFEVCKILKSNPKTSDIDVIFITAAIAQEDELKGLALGAVDYIHKPFSIPIVQAKVDLHLEQMHHKKLREHVERMTRHNLKDPLNAIMGFPQLMLMDHNLTDEQRGYLENMRRAGNEMLNMINNSLNLFKIETHCYNYNPQLLDIGALLTTILKDLKLLAAHYHVILTTHIETEPFVVWAETELSYTLFANLIRNAIEACSVGDTVTINMNYDNNEGVIIIANPGTVPEEIRETFFNQYTTAGKLHGTGIGTYSAKLMAETQKGSIAMMTNAQETCITVRLPINPTL